MGLRINGLARIGWLVVLGLLGSVGASMLHAQETMDVIQNAPGFKATMAYQNLGNGESINLASGGLTVTHPCAVSLPQNMGGVIQPVRVYNSKGAGANGTISNNQDNPYGIMGMNWTLTFGQVFLGLQNVLTSGGNANMTRAQYSYRDESGAVHQLFLDSTVEAYLGSSTKPNSNLGYYTNDGSYIRAKYTAPGGGWPTSGGSWTIYFPDGSTRIAGGVSGSFVAPDPQAPVLNGDGTTYIPGLKNGHTCGWYVNNVTDRAGNTFNISYLTPSTTYPSVPPYAGSINTITDLWGRTVTFGYFAPGDFKNGLLQTITGAGMTESYNYDQKVFSGYNNQSLPVLAMVTLPPSGLTPASLQIAYGYNSTTSVPYPYLALIAYPTGAVSLYSYATYEYFQCYWKANPNQYDCTSSEGDAVRTRTLMLHPLNPSAANPFPLDMGSMTNSLIWTYKRDWPTPATYLSRNAKSIPVVVIDPMGTQEAHFFSADDSPTQPIVLGREMAVIRLKPGVTFDPTGTYPYADTVYETDKRYASSDYYIPGTATFVGDTKRCWADQAMGPDVVPYGNTRVWQVTESEYNAGNSTPIWTRITQSSVWDGFGHYCVTQTAGTGLTDTRYTAAVYTKPGAIGTAYRLDLLTRSYSGGGTAQAGMAAISPGLPTNPPEDPPPPATTAFGATGQFSAVNNSYDANGLLQTKTAYTTVQGSFTVDFSAPQITLSAPTGTPTVTTTLGYTSGNITSATYAGGDSIASYGLTYGWDHGIGVFMKWNSVAYKEVERTLDTSYYTRIMSQKGPDLLATTYSYYTDGRLKGITPPGGEYSVLVDYPTGGAASYKPSWSTQPFNWTVGHRVKYYKGTTAAGLTMPALTIGTQVPTSGSFSAIDLYTEYGFDDLGRLWKTDSVLPDGTWTEKTTFYDQLGRTLFSSAPYAKPVVGLTTLNVTPLPTFLFTIYSSGGHPYGTWDTMYGRTPADSLPSQDDPFNGTLDPLYRTRRVIGPDGAATTTTYNSSYYTLPNVQVSLKEINAAPKSGGGLLSTTTYVKDALGRTLSTAAQVGANANYTYNDLGQLVTVTLTDAATWTTQTRNFTYNALGKPLSSTQPELGNWRGYTYNALGEVLGYTDGANQVFSNGYDLRGRLTDVSQTSPASFLLAHNIYDGGGVNNGKLTQSIQYQKDVVTPAITQNVTLTLTYRALDGLPDTISQTCLANGVSPRPVFSQTLGYDYQKQVATQQINPLASTITNAYLHGALSSRSLDTLGRIGSMTYNAAGAMTTATYANGYAETVAYDAYYRPLGFQLQLNTTPIWKNGSFANAGTPYQYDGAGNILSIGNMMTTALPDAFTYDALSRLTAATVRKGTAQAHTYAYQYDGYGDLVGRAESAQGQASLSAFLTGPCGVGAAEAAEYGKALGFTATIGTGINGPNNRLATVTRGGTLTVGGTAFVTGMTQTSATMAYDGNGNVTDDGTFTYVYDPLNRLVAVKAKTAGTPMVAQYYYDAAGERAAMVAYNAGGTATTFTQTLRNGSEALYEKSWDLPGWTVVNTEKVYLMAGGKMAVTRQTAYSTTTTYTYYGTDHLGTVRSTVTLTSAGVAQPATFHDYEPFGVGIPGATLYTSPSTHRYTGQERDGLYDPATASTGYLDYMHYRFYGGNIGRFMKPDNVLGNIMNPQSLNLYSYVNNNPLNYNDPTGHAADLPESKPKKKTWFQKQKEWWQELLKKAGQAAADATRGILPFTGSGSGSQSSAVEDARKEGVDVGEVKTNEELKKEGEDVASDVADKGTQLTLELGKDYLVGKGLGLVAGGVLAGLKKLSPGEIKFLKSMELEPHELKAGYGKGSDIYKDSSGNLFVATADGKCVPEPLNLNIKDLRK